MTLTPQEAARILELMNAPEPETLVDRVAHITAAHNAKPLTIDEVFDRSARWEEGRN